MTKKNLFALAIVAGLTTLVVADDATTETAGAVIKLSADAAKKDWAALSKDGAPMAKKYDLAEVMAQFKKRKADGKGGLGVGPKVGAYDRFDGIEIMIQSMSRKPKTAAELAKQKADLIQLADRTSAIAAVAIHQCPVDKKQGAKDPAKWKQWNEDMYKYSRDFSKAVQAGEPVAVKNAANKLNSTCTDCHSDFRD
jgi:hypothetical protein